MINSLFLRRKLFSTLREIGYSVRETTSLINEVGVEELIRVGVIYKMKSTQKINYEINESGKLQCQNKTTN